MRRPLVVALVLLIAFAAQSFFASLRKSPVFDEPAHIGAGMLYLQTGDFTPNRQHPPLLKELSALSLQLAGIDLPPGTHSPNTPGVEWQTGNSLIAANGPARVMLWARSPLILLATLLGFLIYWWGRQVAGETAALGALFLYALDPTILAHSYLVTTDVGVAALGFLFVTALWRYLRGPSWRTLLWCGLTLGLALTAKFSAIFLLPVALLLVAAGVRWPIPNSTSQAKLFAELLGQKESTKPGMDYLSPLLAVFVMFLAALLVIQVVYLSPAGLASYAAGLRAVNADHDPNYLVFLAGQLQHRFTSYFVVAYFLKEPIPAIALAFFGIIALVRLSPLPRLFLLVPPLFLAVAYSLFADDLGIRYLIPVLPFAYLIGGCGLAWLLARPALWARGLACVFCIWLVVTAAGIYPDHLSYLNEAACLDHPASIGLDGGTRCGPQWLDDSNVDWGQGLLQLRDWFSQSAPGRPLRLVYFGSFPPDAYGLPNQPDSVREVATPPAPAPGLYAVSAHWVARIPALFARQSPGAVHWLAQARPVAIVGHSFYIYDFPK